MTNIASKFPTRAPSVFNRLQKLFEDPKVDIGRELWLNDPWFASLFDTGFGQSFLNKTDLTFPKYNVMSTDNGLKLEIALAGYNKDDLRVELNSKNVLSVFTNQQSCCDTKNTSDSPEITSEEDVKYIHKGIASREFSISWRLTQHQEIDDVTFKNGILVINIINNIPEEPQPKVFKIK